METISPELALVDATLKTSVVEARDESSDLAESSGSGNRRRPSPTARERVRREALGGTREISSPKPRRRGRRAVWWGLIFVLITAGLASREASRRDTGVEPVNTPAELVSALPAVDGAPSGTPDAQLELRWRPVDDAVFYNVILWRKGTRTLDLWPKNAAVDLSTEKLPPGKYHWFVYPALPAQRGPRFGRVIAQGILKV